MLSPKLPIGLIDQAQQLCEAGCFRDRKDLFQARSVPVELAPGEKSYSNDPIGNHGNAPIW